ncbi:MAG: hypothetical protein AAGG48_14665 [Planctomycetota bacterium]
MCVITLRDTGMDTPESQCSDCDTQFGLFWQRNPVYDRPQYCPFCGEEIEDYVDETDEE